MLADSNKSRTFAPAIEKRRLLNETARLWKRNRYERKTNEKEEFFERFI